MGLGVHLSCTASSSTERKRLSINYLREVREMVLDLRQITVHSHSMPNTPSSAARRKARLTTAIRTVKATMKVPTPPDPQSLVLDRHRTRARGTPKLAFRWDRVTQGYYVTGWDNRFLPLHLVWSGPHRSVYLARKALEGIVT